MKVLGKTDGGYIIEMSYAEMTNILSVDVTEGKVLDEATFKVGQELDTSIVFNQVKALDTVKKTVKQFRTALRSINTVLDGLE